ncbi:M20/M25/M40 family metallo-hydrolase [Sorangium sp. So ce726]|uniref:M20/M25/M40 family metallo-hydrolase n=1 Tax=Sorangium sp. So ce726 TaxID=3133319 RepID=UPI003F645369
MHTRVLWGSGFALLIGCAIGVPLSAVLADEPENTAGFRRAVTLAGIREHQLALQWIADANGGKRIAGTPGHDTSANYVAARAAAAGYDVSDDHFEFELSTDRTPPMFHVVSPSTVTFEAGLDYATMRYSGSGDVTAPLYAVALEVPSRPDPGPPSGCRPEDFAGFPAGAIALIQRGGPGCLFRQKYQNALAAGAAGVIIFNTGTPNRIHLSIGTLGAPQGPVPAIITSFPVGDTLRNGVLNGPTGLTVRLRADVFAERRQTRNVIAETLDGDPDHVIVVGAHLDSVENGPGMNDNGSGSAAILEIAEAFASQRREPRNKLRFIWFSAEEQGTIHLGADHYVAGLSQQERDQIEVMLNFDMLGSPNFVRFVHNGTGAPSGSRAIAKVFTDYFASQRLASAPAPLDGRSDYAPFQAINIPVGGVHSGFGGLKTAGEARRFGGVAGEQYDDCYHLKCDKFANNSATGLDQLSDAAAHAVLLFSKRNFRKDPLMDPPAGSAQQAGDAAPILAGDSDVE